MSNNSILVPIDFSDNYELVIKLACNIAKQSKIDVTLLFVNSIGFSGYFLSIFSEEQKEKFKKEYDEQCYEKLNKLSNEYSKLTGVKITALVEKGKIYDRIIEVAKKLNSKYIILGIKGKSNKEKALIGSNTLKIIKNPPCPVITVNYAINITDGCKNIILPIDLTKETKQKVWMAIDLAKKYNSTIKIISATQSTDKAVFTKLKFQLEQVKDFVLTNRVSCTVQLLKCDKKNNENYADVILKYANDKNGDLLTIMTQQEDGWAHYFVGSTAQRILSHSKIPVMTIIPKDIDSKQGFATG